jgi:hypothetical protein
VLYPGLHPPGGAVGAGGVGQESGDRSQETGVRRQESGVRRQDRRQDRR